ncbi:unnamed protein product [Thlaspi arvense]|uniref:PGG domain-containing protein n=1 Tax=Thlaspi arvense TaxID=13288 RepID=A0AAU9RWW5_THLAR|nr:unnamed protein product [Thlaspi arvense]
MDMASRCSGGNVTIGLLMVIATTEAAVTLIMDFKCTKVYMSSATDSGITGFVKKTTFMVLMPCNCISMLTSVSAVVSLICAKFRSDVRKALHLLQALLLVTYAFEYMLIAFSLGVYFMLIATFEAAVTFTMGFTCTKVYMSCAPDSGIVKKTIFMVFLLCNFVPVIISAVAVMTLVCAKLLSDFTAKDFLFEYAMKLLNFAFVSMLVAFIVGVCLVVMILLPCMF